MPPPARARYSPRVYCRTGTEKQSTNWGRRKYAGDDLSPKPGLGAGPCQTMDKLTSLTHLQTMPSDKVVVPSVVAIDISSYRLVASSARFLSSLPG